MLMPAQRPLPDVAFETAAMARPLDWVGMEGIALPIRLAADASLYLVLALVLKVVAPADIRAVLRMVKDRKKTAAG